ncbi:MAG: hypothetical protein IPO81_15800 [Kouleothrix sp.]|nr:hypothetical protein [Kouleothrix sp.]
MAVSEQEANARAAQRLVNQGELDTFISRTRPFFARNKVSPYLAPWFDSDHGWPKREQRTIEKEAGCDILDRQWLNQPEVRDQRTPPWLFVRTQLYPRVSTCAVELLDKPRYHYIMERTSVLHRHQDLFPEE